MKTEPSDEPETQEIDPFETKESKDKSPKQNITKKKATKNISEEIASILDSDMHGLIFCYKCKNYTTLLWTLLNHMCCKSACDTCEQLTATSKKFTQHKKTHKFYKCSHCETQIEGLKNLNRHLLKQHPPAPFECNLCPKHFSEFSGLLLHKKRVHIIPNSSNPSVIKKAHKCSICDKTFFSHHALEKHNKTHNSKCPYCSNFVSDSVGLAQHIKTHSFDRRYMCIQCNKTFDNISDLQTHKSLKIYERIHKGLEPYKCYECGKYFGMLKALNIHERSHEVAPVTLTCRKTVRVRREKNKILQTS